MRLGTLFSGIEGFGLGFERSGWTVEWQCEIDKPARSVLCRSFPTTPCYEDVVNVKGDEIESVDCIAGGFPCQDLSVAGRRRGLAGSRSGLFYEFARIIDEARPTWVLIENVPGLLSSNGGRDMGAVLGTLAELGYGYAYRVLDAQNFGVAQRRRRVFIVGHSGGLSDGPRAVLFEPEGSGGDSTESTQSRTRVTGTLAASSGSGGYGGVGQSESTITSWIVEVAPTLVGVSNNPSSHGKQNGSDREALVIARFLTARKTRIDGDTETFVSVTGNVTHTLRSEGGDASEDGTGRGTPIVTTNAAVRRLTPIECERLQGFPDGWTAGQSDAQRYRQLGNAVCVNVAEWIGRRIKEYSE